MRTYMQLIRDQRYQIYALLKAGHNQTEIAQLIRVHKSTVSRDLVRNRRQLGYRPKQAHELALSRRHVSGSSVDPATWALIEALIRFDLSRSKCRVGSSTTLAFKSFMKGSTSTFSQINMLEEIFIVTYDTRRSAGNDTGATIGVANI